MHHQLRVYTFIILSVFFVGLFINIASAVDTIHTTNISNQTWSGIIPNSIEINTFNNNSVVPPRTSPQETPKTNNIPIINTNENQRISFFKDSKTGSEYVADEVIVRYNYKKIQKPAEISIVAADQNANIGGKVKEDFADKGLPGLQVVKLPGNLSVADAITKYQKNPDVLYAEPNYRIYLIDAVNYQPAGILPPYTISSTIPNDPLFSIQWYLHNTGQSILGITGTPGADIHAPEAWDVSRGNNSVTVGVVDTGINYTHPDLTGNVWVNTTTGDHGWNFTGGSSNNIVLDSWGHGTHVAGTIGALTNNGVGVAGVNWNIRLMSLKIFQTSSGSVSTIQDAINAIHFADANGVSISSNSWSGTDTSPPLSLKDAIDASPQLFICAAGNSGTNIDINPEYPAALSSDNIISVAASDQNDQLASSFSNYGDISVDLAAPGVNIVNTACANSGVPDPICGYYYMSGTSMATPQVSGVAALIKSVNPQLTNIQIKNIILSNVDVLPSLAGKVKTSGRLNASKAIQAAYATLFIPVANFTGTPATGSVPLTVTFTDLSTNAPTAWNWSFGDGSVENATQKNPVHTYLTAGDYNVSLNASNSGGFGTTTKVGYINVTNQSASIGVFRNGVFYLRNSPTVTTSVVYGLPTDTPFFWTDNGTSKVGVFRNGVFYLRNSPTVTTSVVYGLPTDTPLIGDWNGTGTDTVGVWRGGVFYLRNSPTVTTSVVYGLPTDTPIVGKWG